MLSDDALLSYPTRYSSRKRLTFPASRVIVSEHIVRKPVINPPPGKEETALETMIDIKAALRTTAWGCFDYASVVCVFGHVI